MLVTPAFRRRLLIGLVLVGVGVLARAGLRAALGRYLSLPVRCGQPCLAGDTLCAPMRLGLEVRDARARVGRMPRIWYRASVMNAGCGPLEFDADFFRRAKWFGVNQSRAGGFHFRVTGPDGAVLATPHGSIFDDGSIGVYGTTAPASSFAAIVVDSVHGAPREFGWTGKDLDGIEAYDLDDTGEVPGPLRLASGETVVAWPTKYWPHRLGFAEFSTPTYVGIASGKIAVELDRRIAPEPPAGFRLLERLVFLRPGRYRLQLAYSGDYTRTGAYRFQTLPSPLYRSVMMLKDLLGVDYRSGAAPAPVSASSPAIEVVVTP